MTQANVEQLISKINCLQPNTATNLVAPLKYANDKYAIFSKLKKTKKNEFEKANDNNTADYVSPYKFIHIQLTDGDDTCGNTNEQIIESVCHQFKNIFIGFGKDHNSQLMESMCGSIRNEYKYIDNLEYAGLVYGEIIHSLLYMVYENATVTIENGLIYDYINNIWVGQLDLGYVVGDKPRCFHIKTTTDGIANMNVNIVSPGEVRILACNNTRVDLTKYLYRQRVLELLYDAKQTKTKREKKEMARRLADMFDIVKNKMIAGDLEEDAFWKVMRDDLYIAGKTIATTHAHMYMSARQTSQGRQNAYNVTIIDDDIMDNARNNIWGSHHPGGSGQSGFGAPSRTATTATPYYNRGDGAANPFGGWMQTVTEDGDGDDIDNGFGFRIGSMQHTPLRFNSFGSYCSDNGDGNDDNTTEIFAFDADNYNISSNTTSPYYTKSVSRVMTATQADGEMEGDE